MITLPRLSRRLSRNLITAIACLLILFWAPATLAQNRSSVPAADTVPSPQPQEQWRPDDMRPELNQPSGQTNQTKTNQTKQTDPAVPAGSSPSARSQKGRTYEQPPHPYDMDAIEAYDQEVYGAGR